MHVANLRIELDYTGGATPVRGPLLAGSLLNTGVGLLSNNSFWDHIASLNE